MSPEEIKATRELAQRMELRHGEYSDVGTLARAVLALTDELDRFKDAFTSNEREVLALTEQPEAADYRTLANHIIELTNPPDEDAAEVGICMQAVTRLARYVESDPCACPVPEMDVDHGAWEACPRCFVLGRFGDKAVDR